MKKNVMLLINQLHGGGAEKVIANLSLNLSDHYNITLVTYNNTDNPSYSHKGELLKIKLPYDQNTESNPVHKRLLRFVSLITRLRQIKKEKDIHISISFLEASNFVNVLSAKKEKLILSVRSFLSHEFKDHPRLRIFRPLIHLLYNKAQHIVVPARLLRTDLHKNFHVHQEKIKVIYNFIDKDILNNQVGQPIPAHHEIIFGNHPVLINIGRMSNPKAQWLLIPLFKKIKISFPHSKLIILGDGVLKEKLIKTSLAEKLNIYVEGVNPVESLSDDFDIFLLGHVQNPYPYLDRSTLFIMTSIYEGFPNVLIEAMACGLPIISSDCSSGPREILSPSSDIANSAQTVEFAEYGILTPVYDKDKQNLHQYVESASKAVEYILSSEENRLHYQRQSYKRTDDYAKEKIMKEWMNLIG